MSYNTLSTLKTIYENVGHTSYNTEYTAVLAEANERVNMLLGEILCPSGADLSASARFYNLAKGAELDITLALISLRFPNTGRLNSDDPREKIREAERSLMQVAGRPSNTDRRRTQRIKSKSSWDVDWTD